MIVIAAVGLATTGVIWFFRPGGFRNGAPPTPPEIDAALVSGNNTFALDLYRRLAAQKGNLFLSPLSISAALAMTSAGAGGETLAEMQKALHFPPPTGPDSPHDEFGKLMSWLRADRSARGYELHVANALWGQQGVSFNPTCLGLLKKHYGAGLLTVDFAQPAKAAATINHWATEQTRDRIKDIVPPDAFNADTCLVLANAIYFKAPWAEKFQKFDTRGARFHIGPDRVVTVPFMELKRKFGYAEGDGWQALDMPYKGRELAMTIVLPTAVDGLPAIEQRLDSSTLAKWVDRLHEAEVTVSLPRFRFQSAFVLNQPLKNLGIVKAFSRTEADFSSLMSPGQLFVDRVLHGAFVEVNEEGTEAAAVTTVTTDKSAEPRPVFRADHPFLFLIRHLKSGSVLFIGRMSNPAQ